MDKRNIVPHAGDASILALVDTSSESTPSRVSETQERNRCVQELM